MIKRNSIKLTKNSDFLVNDRKALTTIIKARGGKILNSDHKHINYAIPMKESDFIEFRKRIPFLSVWHTEKNNYQIFGVFFDESI